MPSVEIPTARRSVPDDFLIESQSPKPAKILRTGPSPDDEINYGGDFGKPILETYATHEEIDRLESKVDQHQQTIHEQGQRLGFLEEQFRQQQQWIEEQNEHQLKLYIGNLVIALDRNFRERLAKNGSLNDREHCATQSQGIDENRLKEEGLIKYKKDLQNKSQFIDPRNIEAHETKVQLAKLMLSPQFKDGDEYHYWKKAFKYVYGESYEDAAQSGD